MISAKQAVGIARQSALDMLEQQEATLEEIERDEYKGRDVWSITLGLPREPNPLTVVGPTLGRLGFEFRDYKRFLVDSETGELVAIKLRELASQ